MFLDSPGTAARVQGQTVGEPGTVSGGEFGWGSTSVKGQRRCPKVGSAEGKSAVKQKGKSRLDQSPQCGRRPRKHGLSIPFERRQECGARGVRQVTSGVTGLWQPIVRSDVAF